MGDNRIAVIAIIVEDAEASERVNAVLHDYGEYVVGRMGLPYREKGLNVISVVIDAPTDVINGITGKLGAVKSVSAKALFSNK